jgi:hypothetical protein
MAADLGFIETAQESLDKLSRILPKTSFQKFVDAYPKYFGVKLQNGE